MVIDTAYKSTLFFRNDKKNAEKIPETGFFSILLITYPPKLSKRIMSSSTPSEWRRSRTVFAIIGGPQR